MTNRHHQPKHRPPALQPLVLLLDVDQELAALFTEWLIDAGLRVACIGVNDSMAPGLAAEVSATIAHLPFPRLGGVERLLPRADGVRGKPIVAVSPAFRSNVAPRGALARELGVAAVLPAPVSRGLLVGTVVTALRRAA